jgi:hypothetical protein
MYSDIYTFKNHCFPFSTAVRQQPFSYLGGGAGIKKKKKKKILTETNLEWLLPYNQIINIFISYL